MAYVHWFTPIPPSQSRNVRLYRIHKQMWAGGQRAGGVVPISSILSLCPLCPVIDGPSMPTDNPYTSFTSFYINAFASKRDFVRLN